jgi:hypothetical protein
MNETPDWERPVVFFQIRAKDARAMRAFYRELFSWKIEENDFAARIAPGVGPPVEGVGGVIVPAQDAPGTSLFVQVRDLQESLEKAVTLGGKRTAEPFDVPNGPTIAQIADPEGNLVGLVQM